MLPPRGRIAVEERSMAEAQSGQQGASTSYTVREGDCINSIAYDHGLFWETVWNDSGNSALKDKRQNPDHLLPGDQLVVPAKRLHEIDGATEQKHRFRRKGVPVELVIRILKDRTTSRRLEWSASDNDQSNYDDRPCYEGDNADPEPEADQAYRLCVDGIWLTGTTDGDGVLTQKISPGARSAKLVLRSGAPDERVLELELGGMDPVTEPSGAAKRLSNLGYTCLPAKELTEDIAAAIKAFQNDKGLDVTGELDDATRSSLKDAHGS
jgi:hypothetical protein